jgi:hypothetical protein
MTTYRHPQEGTVTTKKRPEEETAQKSKRLRLNKKTLKDLGAKGRGPVGGRIASGCQCHQAGGSGKSGCGS